MIRFLVKPILSSLPLFLIVFGVTTAAAAEPSPKELATEIVAKLKAEQNPLVLLDYVHWQTAYAALSDEQKTASGAQNAEQYRARFEKLFSDPRKFLREQFDAQFKAAPPQDKAILEASLARLSEMVETKFAEMRKRIADTQYTIGEQRVNGDTAEVDISVTSEGQTRKELVKFVRIDGKWWLPGLQIVRDPGAASS